MDGFDLRLVIPFFINLFKHQSKALSWEWDAFNIVWNPSETPWTKICFHVSLFLLFSFTSTTFILSHGPAPRTALISFRFGNFSLRMAVSLVCSLVFPQALFWFLYPAILMFSCFPRRVNVNLPALPAWNFHVSFHLTHGHQEANIDMDTQVLVPQVNIDISPDGASIAEA